MQTTNKKFEVIVPVVERRTVIVNNIFECDSEEEAKELIDWIEENGLVELQPCCEEVVEIMDIDTIETLTDEIKVKEEHKGD